MGQRGVAPYAMWVSARVPCIVCSFDHEAPPSCDDSPIQVNDQADRFVKLQRCNGPSASSRG